MRLLTHFTMPLRLILVASLVTSLGSGLYLTGAAVYFVRMAGISPAQVGLGYSAAALAGLPLGVPLVVAWAQRTRPQLAAEPLVGEFA